MSSTVTLDVRDHSSACATRAPRHAAPRRRFLDARRKGRLAMLALVAITGFGALLRAHGFSGLGLYRDDAWVALSSQVGIGTAWHMWSSAPGIFFLQRTFADLTPDTTVWQQLPPFVAGVA